MFTELAYFSAQVVTITTLSLMGILFRLTIGYRKFNALVNAYRIKDTGKMLSDPEQNQTPVLMIALTVGYQSIAPFNQAFKELKGITPTEFRKQSQRDNYLFSIIPIFGIVLNQWDTDIALLQSNTLKNLTERAWPL